MGRYDSSVRCAQIRELIEEKQYLEAMEEIEELRFEEVPTITDLYLFANLFLKAEKMDIAKELYYTVYHRTSSRPALYRLLMLTIRMGDLEEAKELYQAYEIVSGMTLDTYELKYRLAKAEGASYETLIEILEELKKNEYTEEWGYQLARLYELQGRREDCIAECEDLMLWFGSGKIVEKAKELRENCLNPLWQKPNWEEIPEPEEPEDEEEVKVAYAPAQVMDIASNEEPQSEPEVQPAVLGDYGMTREPAEESVAEEVEEVEEEPDTETEVEEATEKPVEEPEVEETISEENEDDSEKTEGESDKEEAEEADHPKKKGFLNRLINYFKVDLDTFDDEDDFPEELDTDKQETTEELDAKAIVAKEAQEIMETATAREEAEDDEMEEKDEPKLETAVKKQTTTQLESLEDQLEEMKEKRKVINLEDTMNLDKIRIKSHPLSGRPMEVEACEDVSVNGITYCTLKTAIKKMPQEERTIHFALTGAAPGISLAVAKKLFKELKKNQYFEAKNIGKIQAEKLDEVDLEEWIEKFIGGCMYIENAPALSEESVEKIREMIAKYGKQIVIVLEGDYEKMDDFLGHHRNLEKQICYKIRL
jgi:ribosomal protein S13